MHDPLLTAEALQWQMRQVRCEIDTDVDDLAADAQSIMGQARELLDWKHHVRRHPWISLGVAAAAGFYFVPRRPKVVRADPQELARLVKSQDMEINIAPAAGSTRGAAVVSPSRMLAPVVNMAAGMMLQTGFSLLERQLIRWFQQPAAPSGSATAASQNRND
ncbi:MAG: hypothetical protein ACT4QC_06285 [Planctomycetaceae bacterium]